MNTKDPIGFATTSDADELAQYEALLLTGCQKVQEALDLMAEHMREMSSNLALLDGNPGTLANSVLSDTAQKMRRGSEGLEIGAGSFFAVADVARTGRVNVSENTVLSVATYCETLTGSIKTCLSFESTIRQRQEECCQEDGYFGESGTYLLESMALVRARFFRAIEAVSRMCGPVESG